MSTGARSSTKADPPEAGPGSCPPSALAGAQGPFLIEAELWYQPISYRWASNLRPYDAAEPRRFVGYYDAMSSASAVLLARASAAGP